MYTDYGTHNILYFSNALVTEIKSAWYTFAINCSSHYSLSVL